MDTIIYHAGCYDGFCCAWLCHQHWPDATYIPAQYGQPVPPQEHFIDKNVLILDFSYPKNILEGISKVAKIFSVLDHHKTAENELKDFPCCRFDSTKSGARLTWEMLKEEGLEFYLHSPWLVDYTEDRDLWRHKLPHTHEINAALRSYPLDFATWNLLAAKQPQELANEGTGILRYKQTIIEHHAKYARQTEISGHKATITQCTLPSIGSDIADHLLDKHPTHPIAIIFTDTPAGRIHQLRSRTIDVSEIAKNHGGGGHKSAAGFFTQNYSQVSTEIPEAVQLTVRGARPDLGLDVQTID